MSAAILSVVSANTVNKLSSYKDMSKDDLIKVIQEKDKEIDKLKNKQISLRVVAPKAADPQANAAKLRTMVIKGIQSQFKWKNSMKHTNARFSWTSLCDEATFKALFKIPPAEKVKKQGRKVPVDELHELMGSVIEKRNRYDILAIVGDHVTVTYLSEEGQIRISGNYNKKY